MRRCNHSKRITPSPKALAILSLAAARESAPSGCRGGESSLGCFEMKSSRVAHPKKFNVASLHSRNPVSSRSMIASPVDSNTARYLASESRMASSASFNSVTSTATPNTARSEVPGTV